MRIPEVRARLYELSEAHAGTELGRELYALAVQLHRRQSSRTLTAGQRVVSRRMTPELAAAIRAYVAEHPDEPELQVGQRFGVNQGRVSEALFGRRP